MKILDLLAPSQETIHALVWTLLHSVWQFALIALIMSFLLRRYALSSAEKRYYIALGCLFVSFVTALVTFGFYYNVTVSPQHVYSYIGLIHGDIGGASSADSLSFDMVRWIEKYQHLIFFTWIAGVVLFSIRFSIAALYVKYLSATSKPIINQDTYHAFKRVSHHFNIANNVDIGMSKYISTPVILGFVKPIILFPISLANSLEIKETEAIIAHELAHFVRKDLYINVIQNLIEVLLYYHPAIWWISANVKLERESCCDFMATAYLDDKLLYAKTLVKVQEMAQNQLQPTFALYFSKNESFFSNRIKRILNMTQTRNYLKEKIFTSILLLVIMMIVTRSMSGASEKGLDNMSFIQNENKELSAINIDSIPIKKESIRIEKKTNDKEIKISLEDGKVTDLEIDGKKIEKSEYNKYGDIIAEMKPDRADKNFGGMFFFDKDFDIDGPFDLDKMSDSMMNEFKKSRNFPLGFRSFKFNPDQFNEKFRKQMEDNFFPFDGMYEKFWDQKEYDDQQKKLFEYNKSFGLSEEQFKKLQSQLDKLRFHFKDADSLYRGFQFTFPEFNRDDADDNPIYGFGHDYRGNKESKGFKSDTKSFSDVIGNTLNRDGLLIPGEENKVELTGKYLKINGEKQPNNIFQKYKRVFEDVSGTTLEKDSKLQFNFTGKESGRKYRVY